MNLYLNAKKRGFENCKVRAVHLKLYLLFLNMGHRLWELKCYHVDSPIIKMSEGDSDLRMITTVVLVRREALGSGNQAHSPGVKRMMEVESNFGKTRIVERDERDPLLLVRRGSLLAPSLPEENLVITDCHDY